MTVGLIAPRVLPAYYELGIGLVLTALASTAVLPSQRILLLPTLGLAAFCAWFLLLQVNGDFTDDKAAHAKGLHAVLVHDEAAGTDLRRTDWMLVARDPGAFLREPIRGATSIPAPVPGLQTWTDDFNNLFGVLK